MKLKKMLMKAEANSEAIHPAKYESLHHKQLRAGVETNWMKVWMRGNLMMASADAAQLELSADGHTRA